MKTGYKWLDDKQEKTGIDVRNVTLGAYAWLNETICEIEDKLPLLSPEMTFVGYEGDPDRFDRTTFVTFLPNGKKELKIFRSNPYGLGNPRILMFIGEIYKKEGFVVEVAFEETMVDDGLYKPKNLKLPCIRLSK